MVNIASYKLERKVGFIPRRITRGLTGWTYRKRHDIIGSTAGAVSDYQIRIVVHYGSGTDGGEHVYLNGKCRTDFGDIRFTDSDGITELSYWIEEKVDGDYAIVWVKIPNIPESTVIYIYYGNPNATSKSNPKQTLVIYEDMEQQPEGTLYNDAYYDSANKWVRLTRAVNNINGELDYLTGNIGLNVGEGFRAKFQFWTGGGSGADAIWLHFYTVSMPTGEQQPCGGYQVAYDEYEDEIQLHFDGTKLKYVGQTDLDNETWRDAEVRFFNFRTKIYLDGVLKIDYQDSERTLTGNHFGWGARTGGLTNEHRIRNLKVWKYIDPEPSHGSWGLEETFFKPYDLY